MKLIITCNSAIIAMAIVLSTIAAGGGKMKITSPAFQEGGNIPAKFTCDGANANPPLHIEQVPAEAKSLALIVDDPDAPGGLFIHWLVWGIDPKATDIAENSVPPNVVQGKNGFGKSGYGGPCPPSGAHRYYFRVYALDQTLSLPAGANRGELDNRMKGHIIGQGELMGRYSRQK
jgi:Raf kinase inhibitor-like YbhB/YbcL family protein